MITAIFNPGDKSITTEKLLQWDYGQVLSIKGLDLPKAVEIHFCVYTDSTTITAVGITTDDHTDVEIPDGLLQQERELRAYVYVADMEQGKTVRTVNIPIQSRQKPEIPHTPEDTEVFREAIKAVNDSADRAETAANTSDQNAKKTAEDRAAIAEMVETVSGIEQQVQDVKKYAGQAETAASNAALSERGAKEAKTAALQAKADAETAKGSAETAAGQTAEDKTAVERVKEEVLQAKQQVSTDRAAVEAVERKVAQMGNAIPQAVLEGVQAVGNAGAAEKQGIVQAGTEQKSAVESTGTKAVEDISLAKKTATDAVETAKTGAIKTLEDKGAEVLQSIPEDFTVQMQNKLDKQQGVENAGKAMVINPEGLIVPGEVTGGDGIPIINTISGESPLVVPDSAQRVNKGFSLIGNMEQLQTTGTQLFDISKISAVNVAVDEDMIIVKVYSSNTGITADQFMEMTGLKPGDKFSISYTFEGAITDSTGGAIFLGASKNLNVMNGGQTGSLKNTVILPSDFGSEYGSLYFFGNKSGANCYIKNFMINKGESVKPYEPYTGGKPSPSPEYPQEIKSVGKWNEETQKYEVDVKVTGKNLFNKNAAKQGYEFGSAGSDGESTNQKWFVSDFMPVKATTYQISGKKTGAGCKLYNKDKVFVKNIQCPFGGIKFDEGIVYFRINGEIKDLDKIQVEEGGTPTLYEPYKEQTITLTSDRPITKWDRLVEQDGQIGWLYQSAINEYRGDTSIAIYQNGFYFLLNNKKLKSGEGYCEELKQYVSREEKPCINFNMSLNTYAYTLNTQAIYGSTTSAIKEYLKTHPLHLVYKTETTEFIPLPQSEQNAIRVLKTYYPTTVITTDGGEVDPDVEVTYIADTKNYIDQKIAAIGKTVVETQKALL